MLRRSVRVAAARAPGCLSVGAWCTVRGALWRNPRNGACHRWVARHRWVPQGVGSARPFRRLRRPPSRLSQHSSVIKNQFRLRNVKIDQRTESEAQLLVRKGVIRQDADPLPLSGARDVLIERLKLVVEAEDATATRDRAVRQVESELAERHRLAERDRERRSRVGRGQTSRYQ